MIPIDTLVFTTIV